MKLSQVSRFPKIGLVIVVLLIAFLLALSIPLAWSLLSAVRSPVPIQADSVKVVEASLHLLL